MKKNQSQTRLKKVAHTFYLSRHSLYYEAASQQRQTQMIINKVEGNVKSEDFETVINKVEGNVKSEDFEYRNTS